MLSKGCPPRYTCQVRKASLLVTLCLALGGCQQTEGQAVVRCVSAESSWPGCPGLSEEFQFEADFFALQRFGDLFDIRLQQSGKGSEVAEGFHIQVMSAAEVERDCRLKAIEVEAPDLVAVTPDYYPDCRANQGCLSPSDCPLVRLVAHFPRSCPPTAAPLVGGDPVGGPPDGQIPSTVSFVSLGSRPGDTVSGSFDVAILDGRSGERAGRCFTQGDGFSFVVREGQPYVRFVE